MEHVDIGIALTVLGLAFGAWAWVVAWGVAIVRKEVERMSTAAQQTSHQLGEHINQTERRLTMLETEFGYLRRRWNTVMSLRQIQTEFTKLVPRLIDKAFELGYEVTLGDAYRDPRVHGDLGVRKSYSHPKSAHKVRLAIDLNLFKDGEYLKKVVRPTVSLGNGGKHSMN